jgi:hypothetical protein
MKQDIRTFFSTQTNANNLISYRIVHLLIKDEYPIIFFSYLFSWLRRQTTVSLERIDLSCIDVSRAIALMQTTFLGNQHLYWLSGITQLEKKKAQELRDFIQSYNGPHILIVIDDQEYKSQSAHHVLSLTVPEECDMALYKLMNSVFMPELRQNSSLITTLWTYYDQLPLDTACMLMKYAQLVPTMDEKAIDEWINKVIAPDTSLFSLSTYLFAKNSTMFFKLWKKVEPLYSPAFWVIFWSEQFWRAHYMVRYLSAKQPVMAKKIAYKLPFSFIQRDWKKVTIDELGKAHAYLYTIDWHVKNNGNSLILELFYSQFLQGAFKK